MSSKKKSSITIGVLGFQGDIEENVAATKQALQELQFDVPLAGFDDFAGSNLEKNHMLIASWPEKEIARMAYKQLSCLIHNKNAKSMVLPHIMWAEPEIASTGIIN